MVSLITCLVSLCGVLNSLLWLRVACVTDAYKPCYLDLCFCVNTTANCSHNGDDLIHIPKVAWRNITSYYFTYNRLTHITRRSFSAITSYNITVLDLQGNRIQFISNDSFLDLPKLFSLRLSKNAIPMKSLYMAFASMAKGLSYLYLNQMNLTTLPEDFFCHLEHTSITGIHITHNDITEFDMSVFRKHKYITTVELSYNQITSLKVSHLRTLGSLWLGHNTLNEMPDFCPGESVVFPQLWNLGLQNNNIAELNVERYKCLKELRSMAISGNNFPNIDGNAISDLENLKTLDISNNERPMAIYKNAFSNKALVSINLSSSLHFINTYAFSNCSSLNTVDLSNSRQSPSHLWNLLSHLNIKTFVCKDCQLYAMPDLTKKMPNLEVLILDANIITDIPRHYFKVNTKLGVLSLSNNSLQTVDTFAITYSILLTLKCLNLENNPFDCDCRILWLKELIIDDTEMFHDQGMNYKCALPVRYKGQRLLDVGIISRKECNNYYYYTSLFCTVGTVLFVIVGGALLYRWRLSLRYCCMRSSMSFADESSPLLQKDAYVVYCQDDYNWIRNEVMPNFEVKRSLNLGIKQRDFDPNLHLVYNIVDNLRRCKKVMVIMSNSFLRDTECQFELTLVRKKFENQDGCLIVVMLEEIEVRYRSPSLDEWMRTCTLIMWPKNTTHHDAFWIDLESSLRDIPLQAMA